MDARFSETSSEWSSPEQDDGGVASWFTATNIDAKQPNHDESDCYPSLESMRLKQEHDDQPYNSDHQDQDGQHSPTLSESFAVSVSLTESSASITDSSTIGSPYQQKKKNNNNNNNNNNNTSYDHTHEDTRFEAKIRQTYEEGNSRFDDNYHDHDDNHNHHHNNDYNNNNNNNNTLDEMHSPVIKRSPRVEKVKSKRKVMSPFLLRYLRDEDSDDDGRNQTCRAGNERVVHRVRLNFDEVDRHAQYNSNNKNKHGHENSVDGDENTDGEHDEHGNEDTVQDRQQPLRRRLSENEQQGQQEQKQEQEQTNPNGAQLELNQPSDRHADTQHLRGAVPETPEMQEVDAGDNNVLMLGSVMTSTSAMSSPPRTCSSSEFASASDTMPSPWTSPGSSLVFAAQFGPRQEDEQRDSSPFPLPPTALRHDNSKYNNIYDNSSISNHDGQPTNLFKNFHPTHNDVESNMLPGELEFGRLDSNDDVGLQQSNQGYADQGRRDVSNGNNVRTNIPMCPLPIDPSTLKNGMKKTNMNNVGVYKAMARRLSYSQDYTPVSTRVETKTNDNNNNSNTISTQDINKQQQTNRLSIREGNPTDNLKKTCSSQPNAADANKKAAHLPLLPWQQRAAIAAATDNNGEGNGNMSHNTEDPETLALELLEMVNDHPRSQDEHIIRVLNKLHVAIERKMDRREMEPTRLARVRATLVHLISRRHDLPDWLAAKVKEISDGMVERAKHELAACYTHPENGVVGGCKDEETWVQRHSHDHESKENHTETDTIHTNSNSLSTTTSSSDSRDMVSVSSSSSSSSSSMLNQNPSSSTTSSEIRPPSESEWRRRLSVFRRDVAGRERERLQNEMEQAEKHLQDQLGRIREDTENEWRRRMSIGKREAVALTIQAKDQEQHDMVQFTKDCVKAIQVLKDQVHAAQQEKEAAEREMGEAAHLAAKAEQEWRHRMSMGRAQTREETTTRLNAEFENEKRVAMENAGRIATERAEREWMLKLQKEQRNRRLSGHIKMRVAVEQTAKAAALERERALQEVTKLFEKEKLKAVELASEQARVEAEVVWRDRLLAKGLDVVTEENEEEEERNVKQETSCVEMKPSCECNAQECEAQGVVDDVIELVGENDIASCAADSVEETLEIVLNNENNSALQPDQEQTPPPNSIDAFPKSCIKLSPPNVVSAPSPTRQFIIHSFTVEVGDLYGGYIFGRRYRNYVFRCDYSCANSTETANLTDSVIPVQHIRFRTVRRMRYSEARKRFMDDVSTRTIADESVHREFEPLLASFPPKKVDSVSTEACVVRAKCLEVYVMKLSALCDRLMHGSESHVVLQEHVREIIGAVVGAH